jgi:hypothetical protein
LTGFADFALLDVECRSETCRAVVRWDSLALAKENYQRLVVTPIRVNCGRTILIPDAEGPGPVEATLILDCAEWKATGSEPFPAELMPPLPAMSQPER